MQRKNFPRTCGAVHNSMTNENLDYSDSYSDYTDSRDDFIADAKKNLSTYMWRCS